MFLYIEEYRAYALLEVSMQSRSGRSQKIRHNYMKIYGLTAALCVIVAAVIAITAVQAGFIAGKAPAGSKAPIENSPSEPIASSPAASPSLSSPDASKEESPVDNRPITYIECTRNDLTVANPLRIIDTNHPFNASEALDVINMYSAVDKSNGESNRLKFATSSLPLNSTAFNKLQELQFALNAVHANFCIEILQSQVTMVGADGTISCYCSDSDLSDVTCSTHIAGYTVDLRFSEEKGKNDTSYQIYSHEVKATVTKTLLEICGKYGWIQSWSEANLNELGKTQSDLRNFRYVGVPHALYIMEKGLTFEEYMTEIKSTNYNKPLQITDGEQATVYQVYYIPAGEDITRVPVPKGSNYQIAGNGVDGFIVTLTVTQ